MKIQILKTAIICGLIMLLTALMLFGLKQCKDNGDKLAGYENNWIALSNENSKNAKSAKMYQMKVSQLTYINDSIMSAMDSVRRTLKVKDSKLKGMGYIKSRVIIRDTIMLKQTIPKGAIPVNIDTVINKKWYQIEIDYRGSKCDDCNDTLVVSPRLTSEKYVTVSVTKEFVDTPKKIWLFRIFQKKRDVVDVNIQESNPYIYSDTNKFVEIVK